MTGTMIYAGEQPQPRLTIRMKRMKLRRDVQAPTRFTTEYGAATARVCIVLLAVVCYGDLI